MDPLVLLKAKRSCAYKDQNWEYYVKLRIYDMTRRCIERFYLSDKSRDRLCPFKAQYIPRRHEVYLVYYTGILQVYSFSISSRTVGLVYSQAMPLVIDLDSFETRCFISAEAMIIFAKNTVLVSFPEQTWEDLGKDINSVVNTPVSKDISGAFEYDRKVLIKVYNGCISLVPYRERIPPYSFFYPLDEHRTIRIGGRTYGTELPTLDIVDDSGDLIVKCYLPESGLVVNAVRHQDFIFFLWEFKKHAVRLNTQTLTMQTCFDGDYFLECFKVVYLHSKRKLKLPLGIVREICSFLADSKKLAKQIAATAV